MNVQGEIQQLLFSIVVLTCNRQAELAELLGELAGLQRFATEVIVVDNGSSDGTAKMVAERFPQFRLVKTGKNLGAVGRNEGMKAACGTYVVTLDDDILGLDDEALESLCAYFKQQPQVGAVCFQVRDHERGTLCNWCHPCREEDGAELIMPTTEISEGAVAFRREMLQHTGFYTPEFFISHEGADLAARILDRGYTIAYLPQIRVTHKHAAAQRPGWRRYYYDTRNDFWLVVRNYRLPQLLAHLARRLPATFVYALRDGFSSYWFRAVGTALRELPVMLRQRRPISVETQRRIREINRNRPGFFYLFRRRFFTRDVRI